MIHSMAKPAGQARATAERPRRVQLRRVKRWRMPANTVKVDRTTLFGNPFSVKENGHDRAVALHRAWLTGTSIGKELPKAAAKAQSRAGGLACVARQEPGVLVTAARTR